MKLKNILKYTALAAIALTTTSCLDLEPKEQLADPDMWAKPGDYENFANKMYDALPNFGMVFDGYIHCDKRSDIVMDKGGRNLYAFGLNTIPASDGDYTGAYTKIRRCCLLLEHAPSYANQKDIAQYIGEAYFFRAWNYFQLLQKFGDVIIVRNTIDTDDPLLYAKRNPRGEVVDFIIEDLNNAVEYLKPTAELPEGRVGVEGAYAFLSRVALYEGTWQKFRDNATRGHELLDIAAKAAKTVIDGGKFQLFYNQALGDASQKYMFILENAVCNGAGLQKDANHEYIIKHCYDETIKPTGQQLTIEVLNNAEYVSAKFASLYLCQNGLPIEYNGQTNPQFKGYDKLNSEWQNRDNRMRYTLMMPGEYFWNNSAANCRIDWSNSEAELNRAKIKNFVPNTGTGYFPQKWAAERQVADRNESYDYPVIRYAEVLLNYAEAVYERDGAISDDDLNISLNLTRRRVNKNMPALSNAFVAANGLDMREEIRRERTIEFFQEGFRIDDLKRWHTAVEEMNQDFLGIRWQGEWRTKWIQPGYTQNADGNLVVETGRAWTERNYLYPLPSDQLQLNPNLGQNPGW